jgi:DNA-binding LytR/AlgR family response regulator
VSAPLKVVVVDDEPLALDRLAVLLSQHADVDLVARASGCATAVKAVERHNPDLLLLDVQMRDGTAFDALSMLPIGAAPMIAFVTAFSKYACRAFEVEAVDYLLKPVEPARLDALLHRAKGRRDLMNDKDRVDELQRVIKQLRDDRSEHTPSAFMTELWVRQKGTDHVRVPAEDIEWISAQDDYACIRARGREHLLRISLDRLMASLDPAAFARIHRSTVVRIDRVEKITLKRLGVREAVLLDGTRLAVGRVHAKQLAWKANPTAAPKAAAFTHRLE